jgi:hypothetical protein
MRIAISPKHLLQLGLLAATLGSVPVARAQSTGRTMVFVRIVDSAGAPVAGAELSALRGLTTIVARGATDDAGRGFIVVQRAAGAYQLVARKIGYRRADLFFPADKRDTLSFRLTMGRIPQTLGAVTVTAQEDKKRKAYHIDADEIEQTNRPLFNGLDVIEKLRPDMICGLAGCRICPSLQQVFVNGVRELDAPDEARLAAYSRRRAGISAQVNGRVRSILTAIHPEHIEEITYNDCFETAAKVNQGAASVFIVLKPGIGYSPSVGSYVANDDDLPFKTRIAPPPPASLPAYRIRILGVYDEASGSPLEGADVIEVATGTKVVSTATGTVSLAFLPEGSSLIRIEKVGYETTTMPVTISPADTLPITLTIAKKP